MSTKETPAEVVTAIALATEANWPVSNRNGKFVISAPDGMALTIGHYPNAESMKNFRSTCRRYNLFGTGPARTPQETADLNRSLEEKGLQAAEEINAKRRKFQGEQDAKRRAAQQAAEKAAAATAQGMNTSPEAVVVQTQPTFPKFDPALLGTRDNSKFKLADNLYYCIECWGEGEKNFFKAPQGLAAHRGRFHRVFPGAPIGIQETSRVTLPEDVNTAMDILRSAVAEALAEGDPTLLTHKDAELTAMKQRMADMGSKLDKMITQLDTERADFDKRFLEAQVSADKQVADLKDEYAAKSKTETDALLMRVHGMLSKIRDVIENSTPAQAVGKVDEIISSYLS